jgi:hypothetical protein
LLALGWLHIDAQRPNKTNNMEFILSKGSWIILASSSQLHGLQSLIWLLQRKEEKKWNGL